MGAGCLAGTDLVQRGPGTKFTDQVSECGCAKHVLNNEHRRIKVLMQWTQRVMGRIFHRTGFDTLNGMKHIDDVH